MNQNLFKKIKIPMLHHLFVFMNILAIALLIFTVLQNSWISDDAKIMFRQVWNMLSGDGITFNFEQRVQAFTHPLWFWTIAFFGFLTKELFLTTIIVSIALTVLSVIILVRIEILSFKNHRYLIPTILLLPFSWAFIDYSTSGLENALSYFLVSLLLYFLAFDDFRNSLQKLFLVLSLLFLNRHDYAVLFLPLATYFIWCSGNFRNLIRVVWPGVLLIVLWLMFATFYFGFPLPNTFYAKLNTGYPPDEVMIRGWEYLISMKQDLNSIFIIFVALLLSIFSRKISLICLSIGQIIYVYYVYQAGGDFMLGRFFAILVFLSTGQIILSLASFKKLNVIVKSSILIGMFLTILFIGSFQRYPFFLAVDNYTSRGHFYGTPYFNFHIVDEKMYYYNYYGLLSPLRVSWPIIKQQSEKHPSKYLAICGGIGLASISDPSYYYVDECGLTDPFISRIPAIHSEIWRIGHHFRKIPTNYGEYLIGNVDETLDEKVNPLLKDISLISSGSLANIERLQAIWRVNAGYYSEVDFSNYIDRNIWVPKTTKEQVFKIDNWDHTLFNLRFNGVISIQSKNLTLASVIILLLNLENEYELYVNDRYVQNIVQKHGNVDTAIHLPAPTYIKSIKIKAVNSEYLDMPVTSIHKLAIR